MIIMVPFPNLAFSASVMVDRDLFDMSFTTLSALQAMAGNHPNGFSIHRSVAAWLPYPRALLHYHNTMVLEWDRRGYEPIFEQIFTKEQANEYGIPESALGKQFIAPGWLGWEPLHSSHRGFMMLRSRSYKQHWKDKPPIGVTWPGPIPRPGQFIIRGDLTGLVMEVFRYHFELLVKGKTYIMRFSDVERKKWLPDPLPVHERLRLEYGR